MPISNHELVVKLVLQLGTILVACRIAGLVGRRLGQTQVVSEMVAGVLLGPSLFGRAFPRTQSSLFPITLTVQHAGSTLVIPHPSITILYAISQVGLVLYMFLVRMEFNVQPLETRVQRDGRLGPQTLAVALLTLMLGAFITDQVEIYAVFGAFITGVVMPRGRFAEEMKQRLEQLATWPSVVAGQ
jgi:Kef-type K+ transport system membrane component KefB